MSTRGQRILLWTAPPAMALFALAYVLFPVFAPPLSPTLSPEEVAAFFREYNTGILGVVILCNLIAGSLVPLFAVAAVQMSRIRTSSSVFTYAYIICVGVGTTAFILADYCWGVAAFRPDRDPELISLLNDMAWFFFVAPVGTIVVQNLCLAVEHLSRRTVRPDLSPLVRALQRRHRRAADSERVLDSVQDGSARLGRRRVVHATNRGARELPRGDVPRAPAHRESPRRRAGGPGVSDGIATAPPPVTERAQPRRRNRKLDQWIAFWTVPFFFNLFGIVFVPLSWMMPPRSPSSSSSQIVEFMQSHNLLVACAILTVSFGLAPLSNAVYLIQVKRMSVSPVLRYSMMVGSMTGAIVGMLFPMFCFGLGAFRSGYSPVDAGDALRLRIPGLHRLAGLLLRHVDGLRPGHHPRQQQRVAEVARLLHRLAVRHRADGGSRLDLQVGSVCMERLDDVLVRDGALRVVADHRLRLHLPSHQESARRRARECLARRRIGAARTRPRVDA